MSKNVLVVDDSLSIREVVGITLEESGYNVTKTEDGQVALDSCQGNNYDLIITDINMPNKNGIELIQEVRKLDPFKFTPILVLTTESQSDMKLKAKQAGATGWIVKPFEKEKLLATVNKVVR